MPDRDTPRSYLNESLEQMEFLNEAVIFIWLCGTLFTRLAAGVWLGSRPSVVLLTLYTLVYLYMHRGRRHAMLIRFPIALLLLFIGQTYIINSGTFFSANPFVLSWKHVVLVWVAMHFSLLFHGEKLVRSLTEKSTPFHPARGNIPKVSGRVIPLRSAR